MYKPVRGTNAPSTYRFGHKSTWHVRYNFRGMIDAVLGRSDEQPQSNARRHPKDANRAEQEQERQVREIWSVFSRRGEDMGELVWIVESHKRSLYSRKSSAASQLTVVIRLDILTLGMCQDFGVSSSGENLSESMVIVCSRKTCRDSHPAQTLKRPQPQG